MGSLSTPVEVADDVCWLSVTVPESEVTLFSFSHLKYGVIRVHRNNHFSVYHVEVD